MPRRSPFSIDLSPEELQALEAQARRYTLPYRDVVRAKIVLMAAQGLDNDEIALRLDTRREIVSKWRKRFFEERLPGLEERPRQGRPGVFPPRGGRRGQGHRVPASQRARPPPQPPSRPRHPPGGPATRPGGEDLGEHDLALALGRRHPPLGPPQLDLPPRPPVRGQGRAGPGSLRRDLRGQAAAPRRVRRLGGRDAVHPGARPLPSDPAGGTRPANARGA